MQLPRARNRLVFARFDKNVRVDKAAPANVDQPALWPQRGKFSGADDMLEVRRSGDRQNQYVQSRSKRSKREYGVHWMDCRQND